MFKFDTSITFMSAVALAAIISPVLVAIVNNHHEYKMKILETNSQLKFEIIEKYISSVGKYLDHPDLRSSYEYEGNKGMIYLYVPKSSWEIIDKLDYEINNRDLNQARKTFPEVCKMLSGIITIKK